MKMKTTVCVGYPNKIFCESIRTLLQNTREYDVLFAVENSEQFLQRLQAIKATPDICLISPRLLVNGKNSLLKQVYQNYPSIKSVAFSEAPDYEELYQLLECGVKAHISETEDFGQLLKVLKEVQHKGFFFDTYLDQAIAKHFSQSAEKTQSPSEGQLGLTRRQLEFMVHCCSDMSFKEIADYMGISVRTADKFREIICQKLKLKTRVGIVMYAVDNGIYKVKQ
jgi:two-component system invasion response regulator UvrY